MIQISVTVFVLDFKIRQGGMTSVALIDNTVSAIDESFLIKLDEYFAHRF